MSHHPEPPSHTASGRLRRLGREYGWLAAAGGLAAVVLLCSVPFVTGTGLTWNSAGPVAAASAPVPGEPSPGGAASGVPAPDGPPTQPAPSASPTPAGPAPRASRQPAARPSSARPAPTERRTTAPPAPRTVLLGPSDSGELWQITDAYCKARDREAYAQPGQRGDGRWWCLRWGVPPAEVDMSAACRGRYGDGAFAKASNGTDPYSWRCYRTT